MFPLEIIENVISKFGGQLREELFDLMMRTEMLTLPSDHSTGSAGLGMTDSVHSHIGLKRPWYVSIDAVFQF